MGHRNPTGATERDSLDPFGFKSGVVDSAPAVFEAREDAALLWSSFAGFNLRNPDKFEWLKSHDLLGRIVKLGQLPSGNLLHSY